jgi:nucleotide-binding universal stress UspA family protein
MLMGVKRAGGGMKILIGVDGSSASDATVQEVTLRLWPKGSEFKLVTAVDPFFFVRAPQLLDETKKSTKEELEEDAAGLREKGWPVSTDVLLENPRHAIPKLATEWKADLAVLGSHGRGTFTRLLIGSTAQAVLRHAPCSVEIVRTPRRDRASRDLHGMRVLLPTDGSEYAVLAANKVAERPWPEGSIFKVLACPEYPVLIGEYPYDAPEQLVELSKASEAHAKEAAEQAATVLRIGGLEVEAEVTGPRDSPARTILSSVELWQADLIVMGSHGRRGFDRLVMGSVSESVAMHAHCSVEVVRQCLIL